MLRIEDLDSPRTKKNADREAIDILQWLGIDWDVGPTYQLHDLTPYHNALNELAQAGKIYPCRCSRSEIANAQSAPQNSKTQLRYHGTCRPIKPLPYPSIEHNPDIAWRLRVPDKTITFNDVFAAKQNINVQHDIGDFVVATKSGLPAYQLAVVVDDAAQQITHVVRGNDLIPSTPRQLLIYQALQLSNTPIYYHVPLVLGTDGRRLAKRHGDSRISHYRSLGVAPQRIIGLIAHWSGFGCREELDAESFLKNFKLCNLPTDHVVFTDDDEAWLINS